MTDTNNLDFRCLSGKDSHKEKHNQNSVSGSLERIGSNKYINK